MERDVRDEYLGKKLVRSVQEKSTTAYWHLEPYLDPDAFSVKYSHRYDSPDSHLARPQRRTCKGVPVDRTTELVGFPLNLTALESQFAWSL